MLKEQTIVNYIHKLTHNPKHKRFGNYTVKFNILNWARNLVDGYEAHIYSQDGDHINTMVIDMDKHKLV